MATGYGWRCRWLRRRRWRPEPLGSLNGRQPGLFGSIRCRASCGSIISILNNTRCTVTPLSPTDQLFLWLEKRQQPMHVGGLQLFSFPENAPDDYVHGDRKSTRLNSSHVRISYAVFCLKKKKKNNQKKTK